MGLLLSGRDISCPAANGTTYSTSNRQDYNLYCATDFLGDDLGSVGAGTLADCMVACDGYAMRPQVADGSNCVAVVFGAANPNGDKCYLKYRITNVTRMFPGYDAARRVQYAFNQSAVTSAFPTPTLSPLGSGTVTVTASGVVITSDIVVSIVTASAAAAASTGGGLGTGAITAIGVVGGVLLLSLVALLIFCFLRRRKGKGRRLRPVSSAVEADGYPVEKGGRSKERRPHELRGAGPPVEELHPDSSTRGRQELEARQELEGKAIDSS